MFKKCNQSISCLSRQLYWWLNRLDNNHADVNKLFNRKSSNSFIYNGYKRPLSKEDFWSLDNNDSTSYCTERLEKEWLKEYNKYKHNSRNFDSDDVTNKFVIIYLKSNFIIKTTIIYFNNLASEP